MDKDVVIKAQGLGKKYLIGHQTQQNKDKTFRDLISQTARGMIGSMDDMLHGRQLIKGDVIEEFWALKDINFEINRGDKVGIIGHNGAGKSTLLKVLSRITEPSAGRVEIKGRIASLLEVGTGFHPELSGRENIYLNGAILGMKRPEIKAKFDEIVDFAGIDKFLDTPVKRYSSGMYARLAFSVAAHLEPEILVIDEVLAVGDTEFQNKCLGKMNEVASDGRTVLFVSHNMAMIRKLCNVGIVMNAGHSSEIAPIDKTLLSYQSLFGDLKDLTLQTKYNNETFQNFRINDNEMLNENHIPSGKTIEITFEYEAKSKDEIDAVFFFWLRHSETSEQIIFTHNALENHPLKLNQSGTISTKLKMPNLSAGRYELEFQAMINEEITLSQRKISSVVIEPTSFHKSGDVFTSFPARILTESEWAHL